MIKINKINITNDGDIELIERGVYDGKNITGDIQINDITYDDVLKQFNNGYYVTTEVSD